MPPIVEEVSRFHEPCTLVALYSAVRVAWVLDAGADLLRCHPETEQSTAYFDLA